MKEYGFFRKLGLVGLIASLPISSSAQNLGIYSENAETCVVFENTTDCMYKNNDYTILVKSTDEKPRTVTIYTYPKKDPENSRILGGVVIVDLPKPYVIDVMFDYDHPDLSIQRNNYIQYWSEVEDEMKNATPGGRKMFQTQEYTEFYRKIIELNETQRKIIQPRNRVIITSIP